MASEWGASKPVGPLDRNRACVPDGTKRLGGEQFYTDASCPIPLGPPGQRRGQGAAMISILHDLLVFSCLAAFVTWIVLAAASLLI